MYEKSACGVGFIAHLRNVPSFEILEMGLSALCAVEHRGAYSADMLTGDGAGIMTDIPFDLLGYKEGKIALAMLFFAANSLQKEMSIKIFEDTLNFFHLEVLSYRKVPVRKEVLGKDALASMPSILQAIIKRPNFCNNDEAFEQLLYQAKQSTLTRLREENIHDFFLPSLSARTIVYKALVRSNALAAFYEDLQDPLFKTRFVIFHRRFSTNTSTTWDKAQPFRLVAHNGEINTISGNRSWALAREKLLGIPQQQLFTHEGISDSGSVNEIVEALRYRSSIPTLQEALAIMMPPAHLKNDFYKFWGRGMEPWDGPALMVFSDGKSLGARLDRNGFRPCRWLQTEDFFCLASEAGVFEMAESTILAKGILEAGSNVVVNLKSGSISFKDPSHSFENFDATFDPRLIQLTHKPYNHNEDTFDWEQVARTFHFTHEDLQKLLVPMIAQAKEPIGSMGDTASLAIFSQEPRSFFDFFYHNFAQVTNPPLDYLRERIVTDLSVFLGKKPSIFAKKEFAPLPMAFELDSPLLSLGQLEYLRSFAAIAHEKSRITIAEIDICFEIASGKLGFENTLKRIEQQILACAEENHSIVILTDKYANPEYLPIPCLLALRVCKEALHQIGANLSLSLVLDSGEIRETHHVAVCISAGATALCPRIALEIARNITDKNVPAHLTAEEREQNLLLALEHGLLKIMSKMGISVLRSYENSQLLTIVGLDFSLTQKYFARSTAYLSGIGIDELVAMILEKHQKIQAGYSSNELYNSYLYKEQARGLSGEKHSFTAQISKNIHQLVRNTGLSLQDVNLYEKYLEEMPLHSPIHIRHLWRLNRASKPMALDNVQSKTEILKTFGSGAMSFGAISAEAQRDIFLAMQAIGGRSNSGEGGENPYYYSDGIFPTIKQIASGRFGVTALYLISANEYQIKVAQGAKPGEGGQLMGVKVTESIAQARHASPHTDLISPPPLHDIYSIEDLKELIYELKQINPYARVSVKLVAGAGVGTIAVGVAKAGADIIHISGGDGGTGAASLSSMKHAGIPWEISLWEVHKALVENHIRQNVVLRVDGGLQTGKDVVVATILGAEEYDFGKLLLIAQGCIMARICEKNTCPTGIATHDEKFKAKYKGSPEHIVAMLNFLAENVRNILCQMGITSLHHLVGRIDLLEIEPDFADFIQKRKISSDFLGQFQEKYHYTPNQAQTATNTLLRQRNIFYERIGSLNKQILEDTRVALANNQDLHLCYKIRNTDRAVLATLAGKIAWRQHKKITQALQPNKIFEGKLNFEFRGSAGQGFGAFLTEGISVRLEGEANDSVAKSMSGGKMVIVPPKESQFRPEDNVIIGNCALYGATGGKLYVSGKAGDRFAVRNSGALAVVEGVGWHACEYMTGGQVVILGTTHYNIGSGMTGGVLWIYQATREHINTEYISQTMADDQEIWDLYSLLQDYAQETQSPLAFRICQYWHTEQFNFSKFVPKKQAKNSEKDFIFVEQVMKKF